MSYNVRWRPAAERQLARIWTDATDKAAVTRAADAFDAAIGRDAMQVGESRPGGRRIAFGLPLGFLYQGRSSHTGSCSHRRLADPSLNSPDTLPFPVYLVSGRGR
jgi:hypothetical protein